MSTRATYTFVDERSTVHVYKHHDGYPTGAAAWIRQALEHAWPLPRFEADEFAAAFVAANKDGPGGVRLIADGRDDGWKLAAADQDFHYEITVKNGRLQVKAYSTMLMGETDEVELLFEGDLLSFTAWANEDAA